VSVLSCVFLFVTMYTHPLSYKLYIRTYIKKIHACMHAYISAFVCIHSYALSLNHASCFSVYLLVSQTHFCLSYTFGPVVSELDTLCSYFTTVTGLRPYFVIKSNLSSFQSSCRMLYLQKYPVTVTVTVTHDVFCDHDRGRDQHPKHGTMMSILLKSKSNDQRIKSTKRSCV
jgi:hypothetical protein